MLTKDRSGISFQQYKNETAVRYRYTVYNGYLPAVCYCCIVKYNVERRRALNRSYFSGIQFQGNENR